jgi:hypothetical protein
MVLSGDWENSPVALARSSSQSFFSDESLAEPYTATMDEESSEDMLGGGRDGRRRAEIVRLGEAVL